MSRSKLIAPIAVISAALVAFVTIALLIGRADAARRQQLQIASLSAALTDLSKSAFNADPAAGGSPAAGLRRIQADERALADGLSAVSQPGAPSALLAIGHARLALIKPVITTIYTLAVGPGGLNGPRAATVPRLQDLITVRSANLAAVLDRIGELDAQRARRARRDAEIGAAGALLELLVVFMLFYVRSVKASAAVERLARDNLRLLEVTREQATTDVLTGLPNRRALEAQLTREAEAPSSGDELLLALFDLDGFKQYNDSFGHAAGDALLQRLGARLIAVAVDRRAWTYRLGGDEFCLLARCAVGDAEELLGAAAAALAESGEVWEIGCSYGAAWIPSESADGHDALRLADQRMYASKAGRASPSRQLADVLVAVMREQRQGLDEHVTRVAQLATLVAESLELPTHEVRLTRLAATVHDLGKMALPTSMLAKVGSLDAQELAYMQRHTLIGERIALAAPALAVTAPVVRSSHERVDGHGYPDGLSGQQIPLGARIIAVCDAYDAMTSARAYRTELDGAAIGAQAAIEELRRGAGTQFDARVVDALADAITARSQPVAGSPSTAGSGSTELG